MRKNYVQEILNSIHGNIAHAELAEKRSDYHEKDLADTLEDLDGIDKDEIVNQLDRDSLEERIVQSYPYVTDREKICDCIERIVDYAERTLPSQFTIFDSLATTVNCISQTGR